MSGSAPAAVGFAGLRFENGGWRHSAHFLNENQLIYDSNALTVCDCWLAQQCL
tara:strand:- start:68480 stop:68638 length:159 start_codon:yes stop_codon:yes gene_type:complete